MDLSQSRPAPEISGYDHYCRELALVNVESTHVEPQIGIQHQLVASEDQDDGAKDQDLGSDLESSTIDEISFLNKSTKRKTSFSMVLREKTRSSQKKKTKFR